MDGVDLCDGDDSGRVIEEIPEKGVSTRADGIVHGAVWEGGRCISGGEDEIKGLFRGVPPVEPGCSESFTLGDPCPLLVGRQGVEVAKDACPDGVAFDVARPEIPEILQGPGKGGVKGDLGGSGVIGLEGAERTPKGVASVGAEEHGGDLKAELGGGGRREGREGDVNHLMACLAQCIRGQVQATCDGRGGVHDTVRGHETDAEFLTTLDLLEQVMPPGDWMDGIIDVPGLHSDEGLCEVDEIVQGPCHWGEDAGDAFLAGHAGVDADLGPSAGTAPEGVDAGPSSGSTY